MALGRQDADLLIAITLVALATALLGLLGREIVQDTWLALLAGRDIAEHGIPHLVADRAGAREALDRSAVACPARRVLA